MAHAELRTWQLGIGTRNSISFDRVFNVMDATGVHHKFDVLGKRLHEDFCTALSLRRPSFLTVTTQPV